MKNWKEQRHLLSLTTELHYNNRICSLLRDRLVASGPKSSSTVFHLSLRDKLVIWGAMLFTWSRFPRLPAVDRLVARGQLPGTEMLPAPSSAGGKLWRGQRWLVQWFLRLYWLLSVKRSTGSGYYLVYSSKTTFQFIYTKTLSSFGFIYQKTLIITTIAAISH